MKHSLESLVRSVCNNTCETDALRSSMVLTCFFVSGWRRSEKVGTGRSMDALSKDH